MKCKDCNSCKKDWLFPKEGYTCIGVKHPFRIININADCTQYSKEYWENIEERKTNDTGGWNVIKTEEDLPTNAGEYLVTILYGENGRPHYDTITSYFDSFGCWQNTSGGKIVTAWMDRPEPYEN